MKISTFKNNWLTAIGLVLAVPTAYFILISILKFGMGIDGPYDFMQPLLEKSGIKESFGWNINLLILFGPMIAFLLTIFQVLKIDIRFGREEFLLNFNIQKRWFPMLVAILCLAVLAILFFYAVGENCTC